MFWERYDSLCKSKGSSANAVAKVLGCSSGSVTLWKKGTVPQGATLQKIASYFNVSMDYLIGNAPAPEEKSPASDLNQQLAELWEQLDEAGQEEAMRYLEYLRSRRK